jgi:hypothetical protein
VAKGHVEATLSDTPPYKVWVRPTIGSPMMFLLYSSIRRTVMELTPLQ